MSKLEDFEDIPYEKELREEINKEKNKLVDEFDCETNRIKEDYEKKIRQQRIGFNEEIDRLEEEKQFYKNIIKSILHI